MELHAANIGIDLLGTAIMSNHFHLVLRSRPDAVQTWDDTEVARRSVATFWTPKASLLT